MYLQNHPHEEYQYIGLIQTILENGYDEMTRNGEVKSIFGHTMRFSLKDGTLPILTTKKVAWKTCFKELMFFIRGETDNRILQKQGVHIWDGNSTREFLDSRNLHHYQENDLGPIYGFQWRHWNAPYIPISTTDATASCHPDSHQGGIDQLKYIIDQLKNTETRSSRRLVMTTWNPEQLDSMALPPCHVMIQFHVREGLYLSACIFQRSCDVGLGVPFNILSYSFLIHLLAKHCNLLADELIYFMGDTHIYKQHIQPLQEQTQRIPFAFPKIVVANTREKIEDYSLEDIIFTSEYRHHPAVTMAMIV